MAPRKRRKDWEPVPQMMERLSIPEPNTGCHIWQGKIGTGGYAYIAYREATGKRLHRKAATVALELDGRLRPEGLEVGHIPPCANPACVNPAHIRWITHSQNLSERRPYRWVYNCKHCGRPMIGVCTECRKERAKQWRINQKGA